MKTKVSLAHIPITLTWQDAEMVSTRLTSVITYLPPSLRATAGMNNIAAPSSTEA